MDNKRPWLFETGHEPRISLDPLHVSHKTPPYVEKILDAFLDGRPLDFEECFVPAEVIQRLMEAVSSGRLIEIPGGIFRGLG